jgi:hypothetical protein
LLTAVAIALIVEVAKLSWVVMRIVLIKKCDRPYLLRMFGSAIARPTI